MNQALTDRVAEIARAVVSGEADPNRSCKALAVLCSESNWPEELTIFDALAHEQSGHEQFGFTLANTAPLIIDACRALLSKTSEI